MTDAMSLIRRLLLTWLTLCLAGLGGAALAGPGLIGGDSEVETEHCVLREALAAPTRASRDLRRFAVRAGRPTVVHGVVAPGGVPTTPACRFLSPRTAETRIQV